jgi:chromosome segregation ATPase
MYTIKLNDRFLSTYTTSNTYTTSIDKPCLYVNLKDVNIRFNYVVSRATAYIETNSEYVRVNTEKIEKYQQGIKQLKTQIKEMQDQPYKEVATTISSTESKIKQASREILDIKESLTYCKTEVTRMKTFLNNNLHIAVLSDRPLGSEDAFEILKIDMQ